MQTFANEMLMIPCSVTRVFSHPLNHNDYFGLKYASKIMLSDFLQVGTLFFALVWSTISSISYPGGQVYESVLPWHWSRWSRCMDMLSLNQDPPTFTK